MKIPFSVLLALLVGMLLLPEATWAKKKRIPCSAVGLTYNKRTKTCNWHEAKSTPQKKAPAYAGKGNAANNRCGMKPAAIDMSALGKVGMNNSRVPHMHPMVLNYLIKLKARCSGLRIESTYRDCDTNRNVRGMQNSRHLCGRAADTSHCGGVVAKKIPSQVCRASGMTFINEGPRRYPHCQMPQGC